MVKVGNGKVQWRLCWKKPSVRHAAAHDCAQFAVCWVMICWPSTSAVLATRMIANGQPPPERRRASDCGVWTTTVMPHLCCCCHTYRLQTHNSCKLTVLRPGRSRFRYNRRTLYGICLWLCTTGMPARRHRSSIITKRISNVKKIWV